MPKNTRLHLVTAGLLTLVVGVPVALLLWPRLVVYAAILVVGAAVYGGLYLVVAAYLDPRTPPWEKDPDAHP